MSLPPGSPSLAHGFAARLAGDDSWCGSPALRIAARDAAVAAFEPHEARAAAARAEPRGRAFGGHGDGAALFLGQRDVMRRHEAGRDQMLLDRLADGGEKR